MQEWNELEDEFEERCGGQRMKSLLTHGGRRQIGRQRQDQDGGRQMDLALKDAGPKVLEVVESKTESGPIQWNSVSASTRKKPKTRK